MPRSRSHSATLYPSCVIASTRWPPPGMTRIARPVALSLAGRYGVMLGLWMPETLNSPLAEVVTTSVVGLPSDPGAPPGQSGISAGRSAAPNEALSIERDQHGSDDSHRQSSI